MHTRTETGGFFESLETRTLLSAELTNGELVIVGTHDRDVITIEAGPGDGSVVLNGVPGVDDGTSYEGVDVVRVFLLAGPDRAEVVGSLVNTDGDPMTVHMFGGLGNDHLIGGDSIDILNGGQGRDILRGLGNNDILSGGLYRDWIFGGDGNDTLLGNFGPDIMYGGFGNDAMWGGSGHDYMNGGQGNDNLAGQLGFDYLDGGDGDDNLWGGGHADTLRGDAGNDSLVGGWGLDDLYGGLGTDTVEGNEGWDRFRGHATEWIDHNAEDAFYNDNVSDPTFTRLSDELWDDIDQLDAVESMSAPMWVIVNGSQTLIAECAPYLEEAANAFEALTEQELEQIAADILPLLEEWADTFDGELNGDLLVDLQAVLVQLIDVLPESVQQPLQNVFLCIEANDQVQANMVNALNTLAENEEVTPEMWEVVSAVYFGFFS
jgi:Ca2+-binding RTX toxin-like protein